MYETGKRKGRITKYVFCARHIFLESYIRIYLTYISDSLAQIFPFQANLILTCIIWYLPLFAAGTIGEHAPINSLCLMVNECSKNGCKG